MNNLHVEFTDYTESITTQLKYVVIASKYKEKWIYCKHKERSTLEMPGGHIEDNELPLDAAKRELYEETGATNYVLNPICIYSVTRGENKSSGILYYAEILEYESIPDSEIECIEFFDEIPNNLTYPNIQPYLYEKIIEYLTDKKELSNFTLDELYQLFPIGLEDNNPKWTDWYTDEKKIILKNVTQIRKIHHYGSTAISEIIAKPTIDILLEIDKSIDIELLLSEFINIGYFKMRDENNLPMLAKGYTKFGLAVKSYHIHVRYLGQHDELIFRDYLNKSFSMANDYNKLKLKLMNEHKYNRDEYTNNKASFIKNILTEVKAMMNLGQIVDVTVDRPLGSNHPEHDDIVYPINYGYVKDIIAGDGEEQDVYILGVDEPVSSFVGKIIAVIHRHDDNEDKWVVAQKDMELIEPQIKEQTYFIEKYFDSKYYCLYEKSCGAIIYTRHMDKILYLMVYQNGSNTWSFPKGHMELGEDKKQTAQREVFEETGLKIDIPNVATINQAYSPNGYFQKTVELFPIEIDYVDVNKKDEEISECKWFDFDSVMNILKFEEQQNVLMRLHSSITCDIKNI